MGKDGAEELNVSLPLNRQAVNQQRACAPVSLVCYLFLNDKVTQYNSDRSSSPLVSLVRNSA